MLSNLLAVSFELYQGIQLTLILLSVILTLFIIVVVLVQPGNSNGISALGGSTDTFYGKNKSKTLESKLKKLTVICLILMAIMLVAIWLIEVFLKVG